MKRKVFFIVLLLFAAGGRVTAGFDPTRAAAWALYDSQSKKTIQAQEKMQMMMATGHIWIKEEMVVINDFHKQFNEYLDSFRCVLQVAAEVYGLYYEVSRVAKNVENLGKVVAGSPPNGLAVAMDPRKNNLYQDIVTTGIDVVEDIRKVCFGKAKMTEKERIMQISKIRPKLRKLNKQMRCLTLAIKYTSLTDIWNDIKGRAYDFRPKSKKDIAERCMQAWKDKAGFK